MPEDRTVPFAISLVLRENGWRIYLTGGSPNANGGDGYPVSIKEAEEIARAATAILDTVTQDDQATTPFQIVRNGTNALRETLKRQLEVAEARAASIPHLRRSLGEIDG